MNIEDVAAKTPELIFKEPFDPEAGLQPHQARKMSAKLGLKGNSILAAEKFLRSLCRVLVWKDGSLVEINPLVVTKSGELVALDAKISFDDNAMFRHKELPEMRDLAEEEPAEVRAQKARAKLCKTHGRIGCLVNGAGLAMSTMDIIKVDGGEPANFLDVGGGAKRSR